MKYGIWNKFTKHELQNLPYIIEDTTKKLASHITYSVQPTVSENHINQDIDVSAEVYVFTKEEMASILTHVKLLLDMSMYHGYDMEVTVKSLHEKLTKQY